MLLYEAPSFTHKSIAAVVSFWHNGAGSFFVQVSYICRYPYLHHGMLGESNYL